MFLGDKMVISTKIYKGFQTLIPSEIRRELGVNDTDIVDGVVDKKNSTVTVSFRKKSSLHDLSGMGKLDKVTDVVDLKHKSQKNML